MMEIQNSLIKKKEKEYPSSNFQNMTIQSNHDQDKDK